MSKVRIYEAAKQLNVDPKAAVALFQAIGINDVRNHMSSVDPEAIERVKRHLEKQKTHDVVEERVRTDGRVIKRRAIASDAKVHVVRHHRNRRDARRRDHRDARRHRIATTNHR